MPRLQRNDFRLPVPFSFFQRAGFFISERELLFGRVYTAVDAQERLQGVRCPPHEGYTRRIKKPPLIRSDGLIVELSKLYYA